MELYMLMRRNPSIRPTDHSYLKNWITVTMMVSNWESRKSHLLNGIHYAFPEICLPLQSPIWR